MRHLNEEMDSTHSKFTVDDFDYDLPKELIAYEPCENRDSSQLLVVSQSSENFIDQTFADVKSWLKSGDLLVLNDTKVFPARLFGKKDSGGKVEILAERVLANNQVKVQLKSNRTLKQGALIHISKDVEAKVCDREEEFFIIEFISHLTALEIFEKYGHIPLPPYIDREDECHDRDRYQTVYANKTGAVAAPTAGLHFTENLLKEIENHGVFVETITLHVGAGTFKPVKVSDPAHHKMHSEYAHVSQSICDKILDVKQSGGRVFAVGTTCVRALETAAKDGSLESYEGDTDIFIYPGFTFNVVDALITNFHLPRSTLLMLVSALAGKDKIQSAYQYAIKHQYRFYSYGDAMLIHP